MKACAGCARESGFHLDFVASSLLARACERQRARLAYFLIVGAYCSEEPERKWVEGCGTPIADGAAAGCLRWGDGAGS